MCFYEIKFICIHKQQYDLTFMLSRKHRPNVVDVGPTLHKCYTNVLCLVGKHDYNRF